MKMIVSVFLSLGIVCASIYAVAAEPVDLGDKQGIVTPYNIKKDAPKSAKATKEKANAAHLTNCRKGMCVREEDKCVPGCDPPDENNTVRGCSSCYSKKSVCVLWEELCD